MIAANQGASHMVKLNTIYALQIERQAALQSAAESTLPHQRAGFLAFAGFCQTRLRVLGWSL